MNKITSCELGIVTKGHIASPQPPLADIYDMLNYYEHTAHIHPQYQWQVPIKLQYFFNWLSNSASFYVSS